MIKKQKLIILLTLLTLCLLITGCAGVAFRKMVVDPGLPYSEFSKKIPKLPEGRGRVFIYMFGGGPSVLYTPGSWIQISIDNRIHNIAGATFFYIDLYTGKHKISATNMIEREGLKRKFHLGENSVDFELANQETKYIKIEIRGINPKLGIRGATFHPVLINFNENAKNEIGALKFYKTHETNYKIGGTYY